MTTAPNPAYLIRTASLAPSALAHRTHPIVPTNHRDTVSLGDSTGLAHTAVHLCRLPPGATSTTPHWHTHDDEWCFILDDGGDGVLLVWEPAEGAGACAQGQGVPREERLKTGDFLGFKAGEPRAHALRAGGGEVRYLVGGSRQPMDSTVYPLEGKRLVVDRSQGSTQAWKVDEKDIQAVGTKPPPVV
ncbi:hypothetical protein BD413DRAFT_602082 [Trametes elegans]|nr:hypothetical protein BD413DRAFT_602082 [Trametes elegans]